MNNVWQIPVDKPAQTVLKQNLWKWNISTISKEMWITNKISRRKHIEKLVEFVYTKFEI